MTRRIAVIADAMSDSFCFPLWYAHYGQAVAVQNLYVATYLGMGEIFRRFPLGYIWEIPRQYHEETRATAMAALVDKLLERYEVVVRVDVDEFAVPDPRLYPSLAVYLQRLDRPFVTARGLDVIQHPDEPTLDWSQPVIGRQRRFATAEATSSKTCVTTMKLRWSPGFTGCSVHPMFHDLFLLHLRRADIDTQIAWNELMAAHTPGDDALQERYRPDLYAILSHHGDVAARPPAEGWDGIGRLAFDARLFAGIRYRRDTGIYEVETAHDDHLIHLPEALHGVL